MPSAFILSVRSYSALPLARQLEHQRYVPPNPLVLGRKPRKPPAPTTDRDRPVSRRSKPSSRTAFIGEQPNPWELLHPQDAMSRHRTRVHAFAWRRLYHQLVSGRSNMPSLDGERQASACCPSAKAPEPFLSDQSLRGHLLTRNMQSVSRTALAATRSMLGFERDFPRYCRAE